MYLDAVRTQQEEPVFEPGNGGGAKIYGTWEHWRPASVSHHGRACCEIVKEWTIATDASLLNGGNVGTGPRWLRSRWTWGPTRYPIHWCEIGRAKVLDCGVHAALAQEVLIARGLRAFRAQMIQEYSECAAGQWQLQWEDRDAITTWMDGELIYHEGCAIETVAGEIKLWDPSAGWWVDPKTTAGYGSLRALRVIVAGTESFNWGDHAIAPNEWIVIESPRPRTMIRPMNRPNRASGSVRPLPARARLRSA